MDDSDNGNRPLTKKDLPAVLAGLGLTAVLFALLALGHRRIAGLFVVALWFWVMARMSPQQRRAFVQKVAERRRRPWERAVRFVLLLILAASILVQLRWQR